MKHKATASAALLGMMIASPSLAEGTDFSAILERINLPDGFTISVFAEMPKARGIEVVKPNGTVFVGSRHGNVMSMIDVNRDEVANEVRVRGTELNVPNSLASQDSLLYVGLQDQIVQWPIPAEVDTDLPLAPLLPILGGIDSGYLHGWHTIAHYSFMGHKLHETILFHRPSGTLITADLLYNYQSEQFRAEKIFFGLLGCYGSPTVAFYHRFAIKNKAAVSALINQVTTWPIRRIIMSHGRIIEGKDVTQQFTNAWRKFVK